MSGHDIERRDFHEPAPSRRPVRTELTGLAVPLALAAIVFVAGMLVYSFTGTDTYTAHNSERLVVPAPHSSPAPQKSVQ